MSGNDQGNDGDENNVMYRAPRRAAATHLTRLILNWRSRPINNQYSGVVDVNEEGLGTYL